MKTYKPLKIPKDSAWERKSIKRYFPSFIDSFFTGIKNVIRWIPTIYKDRNWDDSYIFTILQKKIELQREELVNANRHTRIATDNRDMTIVLNLIERIKTEFYESEYLDYEESKLVFSEIPGKYNSKGFDIDIISDRYDDFIKKYPSTVRKILKLKPNIDKRTLCHYISMYNQQKAQDLLFRILNERIRWWWD